MLQDGTLTVFYMLQHLIEMRWPITAVLSDESVTKCSDKHLDLITAQWSLAEELVEILEPFDVATTVPCGEEKSTISCTLPIIFGLLQHVELDSQEGTTIPAITQNFKQIVKEIKERWHIDDLDVSKCLVLSTVLDLHSPSSY